MVDEGLLAPHEHRGDEQQARQAQEQVGVVRRP